MPILTNLYPILKLGNTLTKESEGEVSNDLLNIGKVRIKRMRAYEAVKN